MLGTLDTPSSLDTGRLFSSPAVFASDPWVDVRSQGAKLDGVTDDTDAFNRAAVKAGAGGSIFVPPKVTAILNNWTPTVTNLRIRTGGWSTLLKAKSAAAAVMTISAQAGYIVEPCTFDGNSNSSDGVRITGAAFATSLNVFFVPKFLNCVDGMSVLAGSPVDEADQGLVIMPYFTGCTTGFRDVSPNGQSYVFINPRFGTTATCFSIAGSATLTVLTGQASGYTKFLNFPTAGAVSGSYVYLQDVLLEGGGGTTDIDGSVGWPSQGVEIQGCGLRGATTVKMGVANTSLVARRTAFVNGNLNRTATGTALFDTFCTYSSGAADNPTGAGSHRVRIDLSGVTIFALTTAVLRLDPTGYLEGTEIAEPAAPAANGWRMWAEDNGSGKTRLMAKFATGAKQQVAIEP